MSFCFLSRDGDWVAGGEKRKERYRDIQIVDILSIWDYTQLIPSSDH